MSATPTHKDPSKNWLIFFFICFTCTVVAIGLWAQFCYHVDDVDKPAGGGSHGWLSPQDGEYAPHANTSRTA